MECEPLAIQDVKRIIPDILSDERGYFSEMFKLDWFQRTVANVNFVQDNESLSIRAGTVRGLHFQVAPYSQGKLIRCSRGSIYDVAVDLRTDSDTFGQWVSTELSSETGEQIWIPPGFAHGFMTLQPDTIINYKVTAPYSSAHDRGVKWDDPAIGITWPTLERYFLSDKDRKQPPLRELPSPFAD
ncbi:dTDP-4-dehydrorhamnose 3,5-epimerase [Rhizobium sp. NRK18]|uniref:dTDP-4-dehydrorhamnose 3,5-epimerase n=1 Tax=Rhizobium sp. NRK18 TaxID=2964667 RepID=UPI0021C3E7FB|nr:dTDP-4-dehydrorhamnose 3,5-epimerase [Rhizobium sp. NRK18]MCQ2005377.1 dTDP-4-dehydrorhamnose 3,5-epimerase [Rhizobium sp. NRK18]